MVELNKHIAVCGLDCLQCDIYKAAEDHQIAVNVAGWFKSEMNIEVKPENVRCEGCREPREKIWSPDCWILECCVDKKGLSYCYECDEFPCGKLVDWSKTNPAYTVALERLKTMKS